MDNSKRCKKCGKVEDKPIIPYATDAKGQHICSICMTTFESKELSIYC